MLVSRQNKTGNAHMKKLTWHNKFYLVFAASIKWSDRMYKVIHRACLVCCVFRCVDMVKSSQYVELANDLEINKAITYLRQKDFNQVSCIILRSIKGNTTQFWHLPSLVCGERKMNYELHPPLHNILTPNGVVGLNRAYKKWLSYKVKSS